jgi:hypothetical protein
MAGMSEPIPSSLKHAYEALAAATKATSLARAWPFDMKLNSEARLLTTQAFDAAKDALDAAFAEAQRAPKERLSTGMISGLREDAWFCTKDVGDEIARRVTAEPWWLPHYWRMQWIPRYEKSTMGSVIAWFENERLAAGLEMPDVMVSRDHACLTPFPIVQEITFHLGPKFSLLLLHTDSCKFRGYEAFQVKPCGSDVATARRVSASCSEAYWRKHCIPGGHATWEEIMAAGGPQEWRTR